MAARPVPSRKVRTIVRLEARARRLLTRYERALGRATRAKAQAHAVLDEASRMEFTLTGTQLGALPPARVGRRRAQERRPAQPHRTIPR